MGAFRFVTDDPFKPHELMFVVQVRISLSSFQECRANIHANPGDRYQITPMFNERTTLLSSICQRAISGVERQGVSKKCELNYKRHSDMLRYMNSDERQARQGVNVCGPLQNIAHFIVIDLATNTMHLSS